QKTTAAPIENEADNGLSNLSGTLAMARTADPHSATAQFFINVADNLFLDHRDKSSQGWGYAVFGRVTDGMDVIEKIKKSPTGSAAGHQDVPVEDIVVESTEVKGETDGGD
ncbi:MAG: peptidylprolyl isomerase, partial [Pseudohongiellaceae bacterium]